MQNRAHSKGFCLVVAFAMMLGTLLRPFGYSASHDPVARAAVAIERQVAQTGPTEDHGYAHDHEGAADERGSGSLHGHNAADHSHDTASALVPLVPIVPPVGKDWLIYPPCFADLEATFRLDRPPRPFLAA
ncbi:hypothetical protein NKH89_12130 [Mesorhizobium sp. M0923]|uniref:hypothetical protein n=2 Tax=Mesorhizobium TaxID=68287 RepID=UPI0012EC747F|nr:hypothetical protein [Mesorhizobium sp. L48C026A00]